jgi:hypothetical protein
MAAGEEHGERRSRSGLRAMGEVENESIFFHRSPGLVEDKAGAILKPGHVETVGGEGRLRTHMARSSGDGAVGFGARGRLRVVMKMASGPV